MQIRIFLPKIKSPACNWDLTGCRYLFFYQKYEAGCIFASSTYFPIQNMKSCIYLKLDWHILILHWCLFSYPKYKAVYIPKGWVVWCIPTIYNSFVTQNMKLYIYSRFCQYSYRFLNYKNCSARVATGQDDSTYIFTLFYM